MESGLKNRQANANVSLRAEYSPLSVLKPATCWPKSYRVETVLASATPQPTANGKKIEQIEDGIPEHRLRLSATQNNLADAQDGGE